ncbi:MAG TPA: HIT family protein [Arenimonas sp.]|uniref:HIT family protein n=1 Tax=Arenimonas sp. TaxID=1872635 RepID=UPI002D7F2AD2|nr:HIT family protein [Arenimonas sp.]HEU0152631.1 HIT family protein [Arenimonas sp.]
MIDLDPRLAADSVLVADGPLSQFRLMDDARFPWLVLVPRVPGATEWIDLAGDAQRLLLAEVNLAGRLLRGLGPVHKLNVGALGNVVRQLHVHVVARQEGDAAWPGPVWGAGLRQPYVADRREALLSSLRSALAAAALPPESA